MDLWRKYKPWVFISLRFTLKIRKVDSTISYEELIFTDCLTTELFVAVLSLAILLYEVEFIHQVNAQFFLIIPVLFKDDDSLFARRRALKHNWFCNRIKVRQKGAFLVWCFPEDVLEKPRLCLSCLIVEAELYANEKIAMRR